METLAKTAVKTVSLLNTTNSMAEFSVTCDNIEILRRARSQRATWFSTDPCKMLPGHNCKSHRFLLMTDWNQSKRPGL